MTENRNPPSDSPDPSGVDGVDDAMHRHRQILGVTQALERDIIDVSVVEVYEQRDALGPESDEALSVP